MDIHGTGAKTPGLVRSPGYPAVATGFYPLCTRLWILQVHSVKVHPPELVLVRRRSNKHLEDVLTELPT